MTEKVTFRMGISSRALFAMDEDHKVFVEQGLEAYKQHQLSNENVVLEPGTAFPLVSSLLSFNQHLTEAVFEVVVISKNSPQSAARILNSIKSYNLKIEQTAFTGGKPLHGYLNAFNIDLFLSSSEETALEAIHSGIAAAAVFPPPSTYSPSQSEVCIAIDGDSCLFSSEAEKVYASQGLDAFNEHETKKSDIPLPEGPFAKLVKKLAMIKQNIKDLPNEIRIALVTARGGASRERVLKTLRAWDLEIDEAYFLNGFNKTPVLNQINPVLFFDDQRVHLERSNATCPSALVPTIDTH